MILLPKTMFDGLKVYNSPSWDYNDFKSKTLTWKGNSGHTNRYIPTKKKISLAESLRMIMNQ